MPSDEYVPGDPIDLDGPAAAAVLAVMEEWDIGIVWGVHIGTKVQLANEYARAARTASRGCPDCGMEVGHSEVCAGFAHNDPGAARSAREATPRPEHRPHPNAAGACAVCGYAWPCQTALHARGSSDAE